MQIIRNILEPYGIQCSVVITLSIFSQILMKYTREVWGVFCEFNIWLCPSSCGAVKIACDIGPRYNGTQLCLIEGQWMVIASRYIGTQIYIYPRI